MRRPIELAVASMVFLLLALVVGAAQATAAEPPEYQRSFGPDGTSSSGFSFAGPIAIDQEAGRVYVLDRGNGSLFRFDLAGNPAPFSGSSGYISGNKISGLTFFLGAGESQVAVNSTTHEFYVTSEDSVRAFAADGEPAEFTAGPGAGTSSIGGFNRLTGVAVDANGDIYASDKLEGRVSIFTASGEPITQFSSTEPANLAVDSNGMLYVNRRLGTVTKYSPSSFPVTGATTYTSGAQPIDSNASYAVTVDPATNDVYITQISLYPKVAWYDENGVLLATFAGAGEEGEVQFAEGVAVEGASATVFVANAPNSGLSQVEIFAPVVFPEGLPLVESASVADLTSETATLRARINPRSAETNYFFEYGLEDCAASPCTVVPLGGANIGGGHDGVPVAQSLSGLQANTTYHFRVFAENEFGNNVNEETDHTFKTQTGDLGFQLGDSRVWEKVTPGDKHGGQVVGSTLGHLQAAADGNGLAYLTKGTIEAGPEGNRTLEVSMVLARRSEEGWHSKDLTPPNQQVAPLAAGQQGEYRLFTPDLSEAMLEPYSGTPLSPEASERTPYLRENTEPPVYTPLVTGKEGFANVPPGTEFGGDDPVPVVRIQGATPDLSHILIRSEAPLVQGAPAAPLPSLYEWTAGVLKPVSVLPESEGGAMINALWFGSGPGTVQHTISDDGSRVFWAPGSYGPGSGGNGLEGLYMRDTVAEETVRLDVVQPGASGAGEAHPTFQGANADGTIVFFSDSQQLTVDASPSGRDLYRCEIPIGSSALGCSSLTDISTPIEGSGESAEVQGLSAGMSENGATTYFVARGVLDEMPNEFGDSASPGEANLYIWEQGDGVRYVATLSEEDKTDWGMPFGVTYNLTAASSPNGQYLSFMSESSLTGYDNEDSATGEPVEEVFRYDSAADELICVSCNPRGAIPHGQLAAFGDRPLADPRSQWEDRWIAAAIPDPTLIERSGVSLYRPRGVLDNGRVFFNAFDALVPVDSNSQWDVYEYEPTGVGGCSASSGDGATSRTIGGCVSLMSSGTAEEEAGFLDSSVSGNDVFFVSPAQLSATDEDGELDVYDARVGGKAEERTQVVECGGETCQSLSPPPADAAPGSVVFTGPGNVKAGKHCRPGVRKVRKKGKAVCIRKGKKHHKHKKHHRRAGQQGGINR